MTDEKPAVRRMDPNQTETFSKVESGSRQYKKVVPDVRSDIYSVGASASVEIDIGGTVKAIGGQAKAA